MKPFNLEAAKRGEPIVTRDGREAKFIAHVPEIHSSQNVIYVVCGSIRTVHENGSAYGDAALSSDIFMAPKKRTVWVNLYPDEIDYHYDSKAEADDKSARDRIGGKAYPVEIEE